MIEPLAAPAESVCATRLRHPLWYAQGGVAPAQPRPGTVLVHPARCSVGCRASPQWPLVRRALCARQCRRGLHPAAVHGGTGHGGSASCARSRSPRTCSSSGTSSAASVGRRSPTRPGLGLGVPCARGCEPRAPPSRSKPCAPRIGRPARRLRCSAKADLPEDQGGGRGGRHRLAAATGGGSGSGGAAASRQALRRARAAEGHGEAHKMPNSLAFGHGSRLTVATGHRPGDSASQGCAQCWQSLPRTWMSLSQSTFVDQARKFPCSAHA